MYVKSICTCSLSPEKRRFSVIWASKSLLTLQLLPELSQTGTYLSEMWQKCHSASGEWEKILHISSVHTLVLLYLLVFFIIIFVCYFVCFLKTTWNCWIVCSVYKTYFKNEVQQAKFQCSAQHGFQTLDLMPLEGVQVLKVSIPHSCAGETFLIFAKCLRDSLVLSLGKCSHSQSQYCSDICSDCKHSGTVHHFMLQEHVWLYLLCPLINSPSRAGYKIQSTSLLPAKFLKSHWQTFYLT